jgi:hypothetical protein
MKLMSFSSIAFMTLMAIVLAGCKDSQPSANDKDSQPSANDGEKIVRDKVEANSNGIIKLASFHKTNGQSSNVNGISTYNMEYEAEIVSTADCKWWVGEDYFYFGKHLEFKTESGTGMDQSRPMKKGQYAKIVGAIHFEKTENGWRGRFEGTEYGEDRIRR